MTMDRREFLASTGVAAAATAGIAAPAAADLAADKQLPTAPHIATGARVLRLALPQPIETLETGMAARRLAHRLQTSLGGDVRVDVVAVSESGAAAVLSGAADFYYGLESAHAHLHPAFALFAAMPTGEHLDPVSHAAWLAAGDGAELFDELSGEFGLKAFAAGHTGSSAGFFAERIIETAGDCKGMRVACHGLARDVATSLGMSVVDVPEAALDGALFAIGLDAAEPLSSSAAVAHWRYQPGLTAGGTTFSLGLRGDTFAGLSRREQGIIESVAAEARGHSLALAAVRHASMARAAALRRWPISMAASPALHADIVRASTDAVDRIAAIDPLSGRIVESHRAFRLLMGNESAIIA